MLRVALTSNCFAELKEHMGVGRKGEDASPTWLVQLVGLQQVPQSSNLLHLSCPWLLRAAQVPSTLIRQMNAAIRNAAIRNTLCCTCWLHRDSMLLSCGESSDTILDLSRTMSFTASQQAHLVRYLTPAAGAARCFQGKPTHSPEGQIPPQSLQQ